MRILLWLLRVLGNFIFPTSLKTTTKSGSRYHHFHLTDLESSSERLPYPTLQIGRKEGERSWQVYFCSEWEILTLKAEGRILFTRGVKAILVRDADDTKEDNLKRF